MTARVIATTFALVSFAASLLTGYHAGNPTTTIFLRGLLIMLACYVVGRILGGIAQSAVESHIERYREAHPIPERMDDSSELNDALIVENSSSSRHSQPASAG